MAINPVMQQLQSRGVERIKVGAFDTDGILRGKYLSLEKFEGALSGGFGFCDVVFGWDMHDSLYDTAPMSEASKKMYTGWHTGYPDALAKLDPATLRFIPWEPNTAFMLGDFQIPICPRQTLKRVIERSRKLGYEPIGAFEFEFFIFRETPETVREKRYADMKPLSPGMFGYSAIRTSQNHELVHSVIRGMKDFNIELEGFHTETGPGVYEVAIRYDDVLAIADKAALFKTAMKEVAARHGAMATFMAKISPNLPGCSGHMHHSLWDLKKENNLFPDAKGEHGMSDVFRQYVAGQVKLMPELMALIAPTINSYKRTGRHTMAWAPCNATWGLENRTSGLRVIMGPTGPGKATRVEYRLSAADVNPYHAMAASLASGLYGIENKLPLGKPLKGSAYQLDARDAEPLPTSLEAATEKLAGSKVARELLGGEFIDHYVMTRRWEVEQFKRAVTNWELERYFEII